MKQWNLIGALLLSVTTLSGAWAQQPSEAGQEAVETNQETPTYEDNLLGDLGGARSKLADRGVELNLNYTGDLWSVLDGGIKRRTTYLDLIELRANLDGEKLFGIKGNTMSISVIDNNGTRSNGSTVGGEQGIDNAEVNANGVRLFEAWVQQNFMEDRLSFLVGLHDLNSEFALTPVSANFLVPSMQIGQTFAQSGANGPSVYPTTSFAGRVKFKPTESSYVSVATFDGVPGDPKTTKLSTVHFGRKDGLLLVGEAGLAPKATDTDDEVNKLAVGVWNYTGGLANLENPAQQSTAQGLYVVSNARLMHDADKGRDFSAFLRGGTANDNTAQADWDIEAGVVANGWVPTRPNSEIGLGLSAAHNGEAYLNALEAAGTPSKRVETSYELYYRDSIAPGVSLQPDLQYIVNPSTDPAIDNALVTGMRLNIRF